MNKIIRYLLVGIILIVMMFTLCGCSNKELTESDKEYIQTIRELKKTKEGIELEINNRNTELSTITEQVRQKQLEYENQAVYVMKLNISQTHFTLNLSEHLKDSMNDIDIYIEVSENFYNKYNVGDRIADDFRVGSAIFKGSYGCWNIKIADKQILCGDT